MPAAYAVIRPLKVLGYITDDAHTAAFVIRKNAKTLRADPVAIPLTVYLFFKK